MAVVTLPPVAVLGDALSGETASKALYDQEGATNNVLGQVNGFLDLTNFEAVEVLGQDDIGPRQLTQATLRARTVNCDYFEDVFPANDLTDEDIRASLAQSVPGCGIQFYIPKEARAVTFFWHISTMAVLENTSGGAQNTTKLVPFLNGVPQWRLERSCAERKWAGIRSSGGLQGLHMGSRFWSGHWTYEPGMSASGLWPSATTGLPASGGKKPTDVGWHKFGVRVSSTAKQVRIRTCRIAYMAIF